MEKIDGKKILRVKGKGSIIVTVTVELSPFFKDENAFFWLRYSNGWVNLIKNEKGILSDNLRNKEEFAWYDEEWRKTEKKGYDAEIFRGILYNDFLASVFNINKKILNEKDPTSTKILNGWKNIKVKLSKGGIGYVFLEREFNEKTDLMEYAESVIVLVKTPYDIFIDGVGSEKIKEIAEKYPSAIDLIKNKGDFDKIQKIMQQEEKEQNKFEEIAKEEQIYNKVIWKVAQNILFYFLEFCREKTQSDKGWKELNLKENPLEIRYSHEQYTGDYPPNRNYYVTYFLPEIEVVKKIEDEEIITSSAKHTKCWECRQEKEKGTLKEKCFIRNYGAQLISLLENSFIIRKEETKYEHPEVTLKECDKFIWEQNLANWEGEYCILYSEACVICTPEVFYEKELLLGGKILKYAEYWKCISILLGFILGTRTLAQFLERKTTQLQSKLDRKEGKRNLEEIEDMMENVIHFSNMMGKLRLTQHASGLTRPEYVIKKLERFLEITGLPKIIEEIETNFGEMTEAIRYHTDVQRQESLNWLTTLLIPLTIIIATCEVLSKSNSLVCYIISGSAGLFFIIGLLRYFRWRSKIKGYRKVKRH